jgi:hypothetical protein
MRIAAISVLALLLASLPAYAVQRQVVVENFTNSG